MSQVTLQGNASGTGIFTVAAPNSNTNRTVNLPDAGGDVVLADATQTLTNKSISGAQINSGTVAVARLGSGSPSASNFLRGDGSWQAVSGGVTSLNGQTGAITSTDLDAIGSYILGRPAGATNYAQNTTFAGASLFSMGMVGNNVARWSSFYSAFSNAASLRTLPGTWRTTTGAGTNNGDGGFGLWVRIS
jgi:hypothetical protein